MATRRNLVLALAMLVITASLGLHLPSPVMTQADQPSELEILEKASNLLSRWFGALVSAARELAARAEKDRLVQRLTDLNRALYEVESEKRYLLRALERARPHDYEITQSLDALKRKVDRLRQSVKDVGPVLRAQFRSGGVEAEQELSVAVSQRKEWVEDFQRKLRQGAPVDVTPLLHQGNAAVKALATAQLELNKLIEALKKA